MINLLKIFRGNIVPAILLLVLWSFNASAATRTWTGSVNGDFNNGNNYSPTGTILSTDDIVINLTGTQTITLSANITINNLTFTVNSGNVATGTLDVGTFVLTVNGTASFDGTSYSNPTHYDICEVQVQTDPAGIIFNGAVTFHTSGSGSGLTYLYAATSNPGFIKCMNDITFGYNCRTSPGIEPHLVFDAVASQTITCNNSYYDMGEDIDFGSSNSPTITFAGATSNQSRIYSYDGSIRINNSAIVQAHNASLDRYANSGGNFTMSAGSKLEIDYTNSFPGYNTRYQYGSYSLNASSTTVYLGTSSSQNIPGLNYGNLTAGGSGNKSATGACIVQGNLTVDAGATYLGGSYSHQLYGNFTDNGTFTPNTCTWTLNGSGTQNIQGSSSPTFYNLTENKATGAVYLQVASQVGTSTAGALNCQAGEFYLNTYLLTINNSAATAITRTSGYVVSETNSTTNSSKIQWNMSASVTGAHVFPFGVAGTYIPFTFNKTSTANAVNITVSTRATTTSDNTPWAGASNVAAVSNMFSQTIGADGSVETAIDRWWDITASAAVTANLIFTYRGSENTTTFSPNGTFGAQHWNGTSWDAPVGGGAGVTSGTGTVSVTGATTFSPWVLASASAPLPINLILFSANYNEQSGNVDINWLTATETNNDYFKIERSVDGYTFQEITQVNSSAFNGNSSTPLNYSFIDENPYRNGYSYYRLKQTDINGDSRTFNIVDVYIVATANELLAQPNPAASEVMVSFVSDMEGDKEISVIDYSGRIVQSISCIAVEGYNKVPIDLNSLARGSYIIQIADEFSVSQTQLIIQ